MNNKVEEMENLKATISAISNARHEENYTHAERFIYILAEKLSALIGVSSDNNIQVTDQFIGLFDELCDFLLSLSDDLFGMSPLKKVNLELERHLNQVTVEILNERSLMAAKKAVTFLNEAIESHQKSIEEIERSGGYNPQKFRLFWKLWLIIDETVQHGKFEKYYPGFAVSLYGAISPALRSKDAILSLAKYSNDIFNK